MTQAYPLLWPAHIKRTDPARRHHGGFQVDANRALRDLKKEVERSGGSGMVISTNRVLRKDGMPHLGVPAPDDPGVAVYYIRKGRQVCIPCDSYDAVWKNIRAISLSIKDMRAPESRGCASITDQAFTGFEALPSPDMVVTPPPPGEPWANKIWYQVLGVAPDAPELAIRGAYSLQAREAVKADNQAQLRALNVARDEGLRLIRTLQEGAA